MQALKQHAAGTQHIDLYIMTKIFPDMMMEVCDHCVLMLVPHHTRPLEELVVTGWIYIEAWEAAQSGVQESTTDLPVEALRADVDQPAHEIVERGSRMTNNIIALEMAVL
jgi:hypothetical protein